MNEQYRVKKHKIDHFEKIKKNEIEKIMTNIENKERQNNSFKLYKKHLLLAFSLVVVFSLFLPYFYNLNNHHESVPTLTKVNAKEFLVKDQNYQMHLKAFLLKENDEIINFNEEYSYYKGMSKFIDISNKIGTEFNLDAELFVYNKHVFIIIKDSKEETIIEITNANKYSRIDDLESLSFTNFKIEMKQILDLIEQYPPIEIEQSQGYDRKFMINDAINEIANSELITQYENYIENHYYPPEPNLEQKVMDIISVVYVVDSKDKDQLNVINKQLATTRKKVEQFNTINIEEYVFNPLLDGYEVIVKNNEGIYNYGVAEDIANGLGNINFDIYYKEDQKDKKYSLTNIYLDVNALNEQNIEINEVKIIDQITDYQYVFKDKIEYDGYYFYMPIHIEPSTRTNGMNSFHLILTITNTDNEIVFEETINNGFN